MSEDTLIQLASIIILGIGAQWLAWRLRLPSILFLLLFGFAAGPVTGFLETDKLMGDLLLPFVSVSVSIILFEGGLSLKISEFRKSGKVIFRLVTTGVLTTWILTSITAFYILNVNLSISILLGAILVVTGPTVIIPLLFHIRPIGKVSDILKWEGIVIDPIGALLAVLVFETILVDGFRSATALVLMSIGKTILFGGLIGFAFAALIVILVRKYWIPDYLQETVTLTLVIAAFIASNHFQKESGLFATTLMGLLLANQRIIQVKHIVEFKENLRILIISILFIILSARLDLSQFTSITYSIIIFLIILIILIRPVSVLLSTTKSDLTWREKLFLSWMAPRGIVAAAISSIFALELIKTGLPQAELLVPVTFLVIVGTVVFYGITSPFVARWLKVAQSNPQGVLFVGAHPWAVKMAEVLKNKKFNVLMIDNNELNVRKARMAGITAVRGSVVSEHILENMPLNGIGKLIALTPNDEANSLAVLHFNEVFEREELYQLRPSHQLGKESSTPKHLHGRFLFGENIDFEELQKRFSKGSIIKLINISEKFDYQEFKDLNTDYVIPLFLIDNQQLEIITPEEEIDPKPGQILVAMVNEQPR